MTRAFVTKTSFTAGELDPLLYGRLDLRAQEDGAARLRNVVVHPTGGVSRRPGLRLIAAVPGAVRLIPFDGSDGGELLAFGNYRLDIVKNGEIVKSHAIDWSAAQVADMSWTRWGDRFLFCHPDLQPRELVREYGTWNLRFWQYERDLASTDSRRTFQPFAKFASPEAALALNGNTSQPIARGKPVEIAAGEPVFTQDHSGVLIRIVKTVNESEKSYYVYITSIDPSKPTQALGVALDDLPDGLPTRRWTEQAFSRARGWPKCVTVHQERLVIGGSRDLPDRMWFSKTGQPFNFDLGRGLDDEAISFRLAGDERHEIRSVFAGRQLQVFTSAGEWILRGAPLTPASVSVELQTRVGSWTGRRVAPVDVDGATLFVGASGRELREFLYADSEQAYQAADIAMLSRRLLDDPVAMAFDRRRRWLLIVRGDGQLAVVSIDRNSNVIAWSRFDGSGLFRSVAVHEGEPQFLVEFNGRVLLERFDEAVMTDHAVTLTAAAPATRWTGLDHLDRQKVIAQPKGGAPVRTEVAAGGIINLPTATTGVTVGAPYEHEVEPLALQVPSTSGLSLDRPYRPVRIVFRLLGTGALRADTGAGARPLALGGEEFTGDVAVRALGWRRGLAEPPWRVAQDDPVPCTILSVTAEIKGND